MNRIYQGRVTNVQKLRPGANGNKPDDWEDFDADAKQAKAKWHAALWRHHELFQDAVNYYTLCLAALAKGLESGEFARRWADQAADRAGNDPKLKKQEDRDKVSAEARESAREQIQAALGWREAVRKTWTEAQRKAIKFPGPHKRLAGILGVEPDEPDAAKAFDACAAPRHCPVAEPAKKPKRRLCCGCLIWPKPHPTSRSLQFLNCHSFVPRHLSSPQAMIRRPTPSFRIGKVRCAEFLQPQQRRYSQSLPRLT